MSKVKFSFLLLTASLFLIFFSCSRPVEERITGTWKVENIETDADTNKISQEVIDGAFSVHRSVYFEFFEDGNMNIVSDGMPYQGTWEFNEEEQSVYIMMDNSKMSEPTRLGELKDNKLIAINKTGIGTITVTYTKE